MRTEDQELLPAKAKRWLVVATFGPEYRGQAFEHLVADGVAMVVVHRLEMVEV